MPALCLQAAPCTPETPVLGALGPGGVRGEGVRRDSSAPPGRPNFYDECIGSPWYQRPAFSLRLLRRSRWGRNLSCRGRAAGHRAWWRNRGGTPWWASSHSFATDVCGTATACPPPPRGGTATAGTRRRGTPSAGTPPFGDSRRGNPQRW